MAQFTQEAVCPKCNSKDLCWYGVENDNRSSISENSIIAYNANPAAIIHKWECQACGDQFRQRVE
jgi:hypothetical protein